jgi:hypothetical protein
MLLLISITAIDVNCVELKALNGDQFSFRTFVGTGDEYEYDINSGTFSSNPYGDKSTEGDDSVESFFYSGIGIVFIILCSAAIALLIAWLYYSFIVRSKEGSSNKL